MTTEYRKRINRESYLRHKQEVLKRARDRYYANREARTAQIAEYRKLHPEVAQRATVKYRKNNADKCRIKCREWYSRNADRERLRGRAKNAKAYRENKESILESNRNWAKRNKDKIHARDLRRKALLKGAKINLRGILKWMQSVKSKPFSRCYYCDSITPSSDIHFDHIVALKNGGPHSVENLCVSCAPCNLSKKDKHIAAWVRIGQQILSL